MSHQRRTIQVPLLLVLGAALFACGDSGSDVPEPGDLQVAPALVSFDALGESVQLKAQRLDGGAITEVHWSSSDPAIVKVDRFGVATGVANGDATITASYRGSSGKALVAVEQVAVDLSVAPDAVFMSSILEQRYVKADAVDRNGYPLPETAAEWSSSDPAVATVEDGLIRAMANGDAVVSAFVDEQQAVIEVTVLQTPYQIQISPAFKRVQVSDDPVIYAARVEDRTGHVVPGAAVTWSTLEPEIVLLKSVGPNRAEAYTQDEGLAHIIATMGSITGSAELLAVDYPVPDDPDELCQLVNCPEN